jgi:hypothetical protein
MSGVHNAIAKGLAGLVAMTVASAAVAQAPRSSFDVAASSGVPEFRDPKTGQVWTPETVGQDGRPLTRPDDKAFDPSAQNVPTMVAEQRVRGKPVGSVPITAGPTVPIVAMDNASLRVVPGQRWRAVLYLDNNSGNPVGPVIECRFTNGGKLVMTTRALVSADRPRRAPGPGDLWPKVRRLRRPRVVPSDGAVTRMAASGLVVQQQGENNMRSPIKALCTCGLASLLAGMISAPAFAQAAPIEFRVAAGDRNPSSCQQFDAALSRVHTFTPTNDGATLRTAGGVTSSMTQTAPNVYTTRLGLGGTNFDVVADASKAPKTLVVTEPRIGCRWQAVAP